MSGFPRAALMHFFQHKAILRHILHPQFLGEIEWTVLYADPVERHTDHEVWTRTIRPRESGTEHVAVAERRELARHSLTWRSIPHVSAPSPRPKASSMSS